MAGLTIDKLLAARKILDEAEIPDDQPRYLIISTTCARSVRGIGKEGRIRHGRRYRRRDTHNRQAALYRRDFGRTPVELEADDVPIRFALPR